MYRVSRRALTHKLACCESMLSTGQRFFWVNTMLCLADSVKEINFQLIVYVPVHYSFL